MKRFLLLGFVFKKRLSVQRLSVHEQLQHCLQLLIKFFIKFSSTK